MRPPISPRTLSRLPVYYRSLEELARQGVERISSQELSARLGITASQLRQDLNAFGQFGQQGYGYRVDDLLQAVGKIMGLNREHPMVLVGVGNIGRALVSYADFPERDFRFVRLFDLAPTEIGRTFRGVLVEPVSQLPAFLATEPIEIGVIATPAEVAQEICDILVAGGVKGIWNFTPALLNVPDHVVVENVHITDSLLLLSLRMNQQGRLD